MNASIILNESIHAYHTNAAISNSKISVLRDGGPALFHGRFVAKSIPKPADTEALILGNALDALVTTGAGGFDADYVIKPEGMSFATKDGKEWRAAHCHGKTIIAWDDWQMLKAMAASISIHPLFPVLIHTRAKAQVTIRVHTNSYGYEIQSRPDWLSQVPCEVSDGLPYSVNLKSTDDFSDWHNDADPFSQRTGSPVYTYGYHRQAALDQWCQVQAGIGETAHFLLVAEKRDPYRVGVFRMSEEYLEHGWLDIDADLHRLKALYASGVWQKQPVGVIPLSPPKWLVENVQRKAATVML